MKYISCEIIKLLIIFAQIHCTSAVKDFYTIDCFMIFCHLYLISLDEISVINRKFTRILYNV